MSRWFRLYAEVIDDPKVQRLPDKLFKTWINLLCLASRHDGVLPALDDIAFALRVDPDEAAAGLIDLRQRGLLDVGEGGNLHPHHWHQRQYRSDRDPTAAERQARKRARDRAVAGRESVTRDGDAPVTRDSSRLSRVTSRPPDTDTDTDTEAESTAQRSHWGRARDLDALELALRGAAGLGPSEGSGLLADVSPIVRLLDAGIDLDLDVLPVIRRKTAARPGRAIQTWGYFGPAILEAHAARTRPVVVPEPIGPPRAMTRADQEIKNQIAIVARLKAAASDATEEDLA